MIGDGEQTDFIANNLNESAIFVVKNISFTPLTPQGKRILNFIYKSLAIAESFKVAFYKPKFNIFHVIFVPLSLSNGVLFVSAFHFSTTQTTFLIISFK